MTGLCRKALFTGTISFTVSRDVITVGVGKRSLFRAVFSEPKPFYNQ